MGLTEDDIRQWPDEDGWHGARVAIGNGARIGDGADVAAGVRLAEGAVVPDGACVVGVA